MNASTESKHPKLLKGKLSLFLATLLLGFTIVGVSSALEELIVGGSRLSASAKKSSALEGASLQTVPEQELFKLRRAQEFAEEGDFRSAIALWQSVLDTAGSQLKTRDEWKYQTSRHEYTKYVTVAREIESILADLSPDGLNAYRLRADGEARALLSNPGDRTRAEVLSEVVRRFFLSSEGDEAAFELACLKLDRYEFTGASRLLRKCLDEHPDCTVSKEEILLRLAVANGRIGDSDGANAALKKLGNIKDKQRMELVSADVLHGDSATATSLVKNNWPMRFGSADRSGTMRALPDTALRDDLSETWSREYDVKQSPTPATNQNAGFGYGGGFIVFDSGLIRGQQAAKNKTTKPAQNIKRELMVQRWQKGGWKPVGGMLFHEGMVYFKRENRVVCCSAVTGELEWMGLENSFEPPQNASQMMMAMMARNNNAKTNNSANPTRPEEIQLFGDQVYQAMSIGDGNFYSIEGRTWMDKKKAAPQPNQRSPYGMSAPPRSRENWLTAYDVVNGKLKWRRTARDEELEDSKFDVGFTSAPISGGGMTYVATNDSGSVWLLAIDPETGDTVWRTFVCDEPSGTCSAWAATGISYAGGDVYLGTGAGLVAAVDGVAGALRWVVRYDRSGKSSPFPNPYGGQMKFGTVTGWREDVVVPTGRALVVMGSDSGDIFALDRRTGEILWDSPREIERDRPTDYYLGSQGNRVYVAGQSSVRCYNTVGGRAIWETALEEDSLGAGMVTEDAIYVPSGSTIVKLSLDDGKKLDEAKLVSVSREPVGNIYSDGRQIYAVGMARIYALANLQDRIDELDEGVAKRDVNAVIARAKFRGFQGDIDSTWKDLDLAFEILKEAKPPHESCKTILDLYAELELPDKSTVEVLSRLNAISTTLSASKEDASESSTEVSAQLEETLAQTLYNVKSAETPGLAVQIMAIAPLCSKERLVARASAALKVTSSQDDLELFRTALDAKETVKRRLAVAGISQLGKSAFDDRFRSLAEEDASESLRFDVSVTLLNVGERSALDRLVDLLSSEDKEVSRLSHYALTKVTGREFASMPSDAEERAEFLDDWKTWVAENGETAKLQLPHLVTGTLLGRTLLSYVQRGRVVEFDEFGKETWILNLNQPCCAIGLPNGNRLVASMSSKNLIEYDAKGEKVWEQRVSGTLSRATRLDNGNTLAAIQLPPAVIEYKPDGTIAWKYSAPGQVSDARRLPNGNTLVTLLSTGKMLEVNAKKKVVWERAGLAKPMSVQPLDNGNFLVALAGGNRVVEMNRTNESIWEVKDINGILDAQRLPNGNTLVASVGGVQEFGRDGSQVESKWYKKQAGVTLHRRGRPRVVSSDPNQMVNRVHRF